MWHHKLKPKLCRLCRRLTHTAVPPGELHKIKKPPVASTVGVSAPEKIWEQEKIRNIGIMAHIDAGKTTTTERMLYFAGFTKHLGNVDAGDTITDYMIQERERGITITSAAVTFNWNKHRINLIDTPGHVDFTVEVERCLRVLDGAVTVIDASAGVEAQTVTVWRQAEKFGIPSIVYLNKMDKPAASVAESLKSIQEKLRIKPLLLYEPNAEGKEFSSVVDLVHMERWTWPRETNGKYPGISQVKADADSTSFAMLKPKRDALLESLADADDKFAEILLAAEPDSSLPFLANQTTPKIAPGEIVAAIRRATLQRKIVPVCLGSSLKNKGVQILLDNICRYLPAPNERSHSFLNLYYNHFCALAFKITHDKHKGPLTFVRVYSGALHPNAEIYNINRDKTEHVPRLYVPQSDEMKETRVLHHGNIGVLAGLKATITGDTLVESRKVCDEVAAVYKDLHAKEASATTSLSAGKPVQSTTASGDSSRPVLAAIEAPEPVFFCSIEPPSQKDQNQFDVALAALQKEDPSLRFRQDAESQQTIMEGMGELHIEIVKDRIKREYGLDCYVGPLQVNYREGISGRAEHSLTLEETQNARKNRVSLTLSVAAFPGSGPFRRVAIGHIQGERSLEAMRHEWIEAIQEGVVSACRSGPLLGYTVQDVYVTLTAFEASRATNPALVVAAANQCATDSFKMTGSYLMEPIMLLEITVDQNRVGAVLSDLSKRRAQIEEVSAPAAAAADLSVRLVRCTAPLAELMGYSSALRSLTSGSALLHMEVFGYRQLSADEQRETIEKLTGGVRL